jgi:hypothetical protein
MHQLHPLHFSSSTIMTPVSSDCFKAFLGQAITQGAGLQSLQATDTLARRFNLMLRILDFCVLKAFSLAREHMCSQTVQPVHLSGSHVTSFHLEVSTFEVAVNFIPLVLLRVCP